SSDLEQRECDVLRARRLDPAVHVRLHELPDGVPPRSDDHGSPRRAVVGQFGARNDVLVPGGEVLRLRGEYGLLHGVTVAAVATGYPGFRTVSNDSPDRGHPGRSAAGGPASTTAPPLHHSVGTGWYDRRRHPDHGYEIDRVDASGCSAAPTKHSTRARRRATHREGGELWRCTPAPACTPTTRRSPRKAGATASTWATT